MHRSPQQYRIAFIFGECNFLLFYVTLKLLELGFAVMYLFYFVVFINSELFPFLFSLNSTQFATPKLIMMSTAPAFVVTTLCLVPCLKGEKMPLGIYTFLIAFFDR